MIRETAVTTFISTFSNKHKMQTVDILTGVQATSDCQMLLVRCPSVHWSADTWRTDRDKQLDFCICSKPLVLQSEEKQKNHIVLATENVKKSLNQAAKSERQNAKNGNRIGCMRHRNACCCNSVRVYFTTSSNSNGLQISIVICQIMWKFGVTAVKLSQIQQAFEFLNVCELTRQNGQF